MASTLDCMLCLLRQSLEAARYSTDDESKHAEILEKAMRLTLKEGFDADPPMLGTIIHRIAREVADDPDPYLSVKKKYNKIALEQLRLVRRWIADSQEKFETTLRLAIAGNSIDCALGALDDAKVDQAIRKAIESYRISDEDKARLRRGEY